MHQTMSSNWSSHSQSENCKLARVSLATTDSLAATEIKQQREQLLSNNKINFRLCPAMMVYVQ